MFVSLRIILIMHKFLLGYLEYFNKHDFVSIMDTINRNVHDLVSMKLFNFLR